jgi:hypothetical protein
MEFGRARIYSSRFQIYPTLQELTARYVSDLGSMRTQTGVPPFAYAARMNSRPTESHYPITPLPHP